MGGGLYQKVVRTTLQRILEGSGEVLKEMVHP